MIINRKQFEIFGVDDTRLIPKKKSGIYIILSFNDDKKKRIHYIGRTVDLKLRLFGHKSLFAALSKDGFNVIKVAFLSVPNWSDRAKMERVFVSKYKPKYNIHLKKTKSIPLSDLKLLRLEIINRGISRLNDYEKGFLDCLNWITINKKRPKILNTKFKK